MAFRRMSVKTAFAERQKKESRTAIILSGAAFLLGGSAGLAYANALCPFEVVFFVFEGHEVNAFFVRHEIEMLLHG